MAVTENVPAPPRKGRPWWQTTTAEIARLLSTDPVKGLSGGEAAARLRSGGPNQLKEKRAISPLTLLLEQFDDFIVWVLVGAAMVSGFLREWIDAAAILVIVIVNAMLGFIQEYRAERSLAALKKLASPSSKVVRDGRATVVPSLDIVAGDVVELEAGDYVPCDGRVVSHTPNFATQEASLTGESNPVMKTESPLQEREVALADRANMVYLGTSVVSGKARAVIVATGMDTELGKIAGMIQEIGRETTPLQKRLENFGKLLVYVAFVLVAVVFLLGLLRGEELLDMFLTSVSLAVAAIPEGLPAVVTIALALGVQRMVRRNALIRKLPSVETLGSATVICSDKTGTLTRNEMTVRAVYTAERLFGVTGAGYAPAGAFILEGNPVSPDRFPVLRKVLRCGVLCNGSSLIEEGGAARIVGDPTEGALLAVAAKAGLRKSELEARFTFVEEIPFDSERKKMTIIRKGDGAFYAFVKGAPDVLLNDCTRIEGDGGIRPLGEADRKTIVAANNDLADRALRVLALGYRPLDAAPAHYDARVIEKDIVFLGLVAMIDPPREEVKDAMKKCVTAGIRTVMITGDHKNTAVAIARELGFFTEGSLALTGDDLDAASDDELFGKVKRVSVYARVSPEHKLRVVRAWKRHGDIVAMTGDGVNDAPAVKEADIGVAMGITGTDVTKEVSDMVVTDDNFASIVAAVEEGRGIYDNIRKFIHYLLSCNIGEIFVMFTASLAGLPIPLLPIHILWVNLVTDGLPALALGVDPVAPDIMNRPPRPTGEPIITRRRGGVMLYQGALIAVSSLLAFSFVLFAEGGSMGRARTAAFIVLATAQLFHSFNMRHMSRSVLGAGMFANRKLLLAVGVSFALLVAAVYVPFFHVIFKTEPLGLYDWARIVAVSSIPLWGMEAYKLARKYG